MKISAKILVMAYIYQEYLENRAYIPQSKLDRYKRAYNQSNQSTPKQENITYKLNQ